MVSPAARGSGLGRELLARLCAEQPMAWLATHLDSPAVGFYHHLGWRRYGQLTTTSGAPLEVYVTHTTAAG